MNETLLDDKVADDLDMDSQSSTTEETQVSVEEGRPEWLL